MSRTLCRLAVAAASAAAVSLVALVPSPAVAGSLFFSKSSGTTATISWLEMGTLPAAANALGNAHFGDLFVEEMSRGRARAFGTIYDLDCQPGVVPQRPGGHGEQPTVPGCKLVGTRFLSGGTGLSFSIDRTLTTAKLTGSLSVGDAHGEGPVGAPPVSIVWKGYGDLRSFSDSGRFTDEFSTYTYRYSMTGRSATLAGGSRIGPMIFDDEPGESSTADMGRYRSSDRSRI